MGPSAAWLSASAWLGWSKRPCSRDEPPSSLRLADEESGVKRWWLLERTAALKPGSFSKVYPSHLHSSICEGNLIATPDLTLDRMRRAARYACCNISQSKERVRVCSLSSNFLFFFIEFLTKCVQQCLWQWLKAAVSNFKSNSKNNECVRQGFLNTASSAIGQINR